MSTPERQINPPEPTTPIHEIEAQVREKVHKYMTSPAFVLDQFNEAYPGHDKPDALQRQNLLCIRIGTALLDGDEAEAGHLLKFILDNARRQAREEVEYGV